MENRLLFFLFGFDAIFTVLTTQHEKKSAKIMKPLKIIDITWQKYRLSNTTLNDKIIENSFHSFFK